MGRELMFISTETGMGAGENPRFNKSLVWFIGEAGELKGPVTQLLLSLDMVTEAITSHACWWALGAAF